MNESKIAVPFGASSPESEVPAKPQRRLFSAEEKKRILQLLQRFLEQPEGELAVQVGLSEAHPSMRELSLIGVSIGLPGGLAAKIAVLGPVRMNYEKAMSAVLHIGRAFQTLPDESHPGGAQWPPERGVLGAVEAHRLALEMDRPRVGRDGAGGSRDLAEPAAVRPDRPQRRAERRCRRPLDEPRRRSRKMRAAHS